MAHHEEFMGERVRVILCELGVGIIGIPVGPGPLVTIKEKHGRDIVINTLLIRDAVWDNGCVEVEAVALGIGENCSSEVERMVTMAAEKIALLGCTMARVSRAREGWQVAGWRLAPDRLPAHGAGADGDQACQRTRGDRRMRIARRFGR